MQAFHFGTSKEPLFGVYHPPEGRSSGGIVICQPLGHEYIRAHRALRNLAVRLSASGFHVLRFDYFGCGDSSGAGDDASLTRWRLDIGTAIDELKDMAGLSRVSMLGVRFGGTLGALAAARRKDLDALVLWDPVMQGRAYVRELLHVEDQWLKARPGLNRTAGEHEELIGFPLTSRMREEFEATDLSSSQEWPFRRIALLASNGCDVGQLSEQIGRSHPQVSVQQVACDCQWHRPEAVHLALLVNEMLQEIATIFENRVVA